MYKRKRFIFILSIGIFLLFSISFVSASLFEDVWNKITGRVISECIDSDVTGEYPEGKNIYVKGMVTSGEIINEDSCNENHINLVYEQVCSVFGTPAGYNIACNAGYICSDGKCIEETLCTDSDDGKNYYVSGFVVTSEGTQTDSCSDLQTLNELFCVDNDFSSEVFECPEGYVCFTGRCIQGEECSDTDITSDYPNGINAYLKGTVNFAGLQYPDSCSGINGLTEYYCHESVKSFRAVTCANGCGDGACIEVCTPDCTGKECGDDGCDGSCGSCDSEETCVNGQCIICTPDCTGKECGDDGCDGSCGSCSTGKFCQNNHCVNRCEDSDVTVEYPDGLNPYVKGTATRADSGNILEDYCDERYENILKEAHCSSSGYGYHKSLGCKEGEICEVGVCIESCVPDCTGKECGDDGCDGICGVCVNGKICEDGVCIEDCTPDCTGKECGNDGCDGSCGVCVDGKVCEDNTCVKPSGENKKDRSMYSNKEVFLISDLDWKDALSLVPLTTWTSQDEIDESWCQQGYLTADNVCVYPTLIFHGEMGDYCVNVDVEDFRLNIFPEEINTYLYSGELYANIELDSDNICPGNAIKLKITLENLGEEDIYLEKFVVTNYPSQLKLSQETIIIDKILHPNDIEITEIDFNYPIEDSIISFDADSSIYFMQQYDTNKLTISGETSQELDNLLIAEPELGAGLEESQIQRINLENYLDYWQSFKDIVYVEEDYELALLASTYASLINAPLIIQGSSLDIEAIFQNRNIICVGSPSPPTGIYCNEQYNLEQLQTKYMQDTNTDKIILVNSNDLEIRDEISFEPEKSPDVIRIIHTKNSLASPILASAKHELIIPTDKINHQDVNNFIQNKINELQNEFVYLTILASPNAIESSYVDSTWGKVSADANEYNQLNEDSFKDIAIGRIFGFTISDSSSYIARSLYYDKILKNDKKMLIARGLPFITSLAELYVFQQVLDKTGYRYFITFLWNPTNSDIEFWKNKFYIHYRDHGGPNWAGIRGTNIPYLDNSFLNIDACSTCGSTGEESFCVNAIRKGAIGYIGAVSATGFFYNEEFLSEIFSHNSDIGNAFINSINSNNIKRKKYFPTEYILLGDPTLKLKTVYNLPAPTMEFIQDTSKGKLYKLNLPFLKVSIPEDIKNSCEVPYGVGESTVFTTAFTSFLNLKRNPNYFNYYFDYSDDFKPIAASKKFRIFYQPNLGKMWLESPITREGYFLNGNENGFINEEIEIEFVENAPELLVENIHLFNENLHFNIKNTGNGNANTIINYESKVFGCDSEGICILDWLSYLDINKELSLFLTPGESKEVITDWSIPSPGDKKLSDYKNVEVTIKLITPEDFIEINPENSISEVVENEYS